MFEKLKSLLKKKSFWVVAVLVVVVGGFALAGRGGSKVVLTTEDVRSGELVQTVDATGTLQSVHETRLSFETSGIVGTVNVKVGDRVKAGALLASLRAADQYAETQEAAASLRVAEATAASARVSVENAQQAVLRAQAEGAQNVAEARASLRSSLTSAMIDARKAFSDADEIIGVDNQFANLDYKGVLSTLNSNALVDAKNAYATTKVSLLAAETSVFALSASSSANDVDAAGTVVDRALSDVSQLLLATSRVLDATAVAAGDFTAADLTALKNSFNATRTSAQAAQDAVRNARQALDAAVLAASQAEDAAVATRKSAEATASVQAQEMSRAGAQSASSAVRLSKTALRSPIAGTVTAVSVDPGELALSGTPVITVQTVDGQFEIVAQIAEADVSKVALGDLADVTFDAFGDRTTFAAQVVSIDPAQQLVDGVVIYEAKLALRDVSKDTVLKPGMTADATIITERIPDVLTVPQRAVLLKDGGNVVRVQTGEGTFEERAVTTGLRGDGGRVQILEGLTAGEKVVISVK